MKSKIINLILSFCVIVLFTQCEDFLEEEALDTYTAENFPQSVEDAEAMVNQAYQLAGNHFGGFYYNDVVLYPTEFSTTRNAGAANSRAQLDNYQVDNGNSGLSFAWERGYRIIRQANATIAATDNLLAQNPDNEVIARINAEAKVLRAYTYYDFGIIFGGVPLILNRLTSLEDASQPIASLDAVYSAVIQDLTEAEPNLPHDYPSGETGRITRGAARALLGNVYLQRAMDPEGVGQPGDIESAITWLRRVVNAEGGGKAYSLEPDFINLFGNDNVNSMKYSNEIIFQFWMDVTACCRNGYYSNSNPRDTPFGSAWGNTVGEVPFYLSFDSNDERLHVSFYDTIENANNSGQTLIYDWQRPWADNFEHDGAPFGKWIDPNHDRTGSNNNVIVIRYAEVLLNLSEALTRQAGGPTAEAIALLNQVRNRAKLPDLNPAPTSFEDMEVALFNELRWETFFESNGLTDGHRFFRLYKERIEANSRWVTPPVPPGESEHPARRFDAAPDIPITLTLDNYRMPIPLSELDANPALDSPGSGG